MAALRSLFIATILVYLLLSHLGVNVGQQGLFQMTKLICSMAAPCGVSVPSPAVLAASSPGEGAAISYRFYDATSGENNASSQPKVYQANEVTPELFSIGGSTR